MEIFQDIKTSTSFSSPFVAVAFVGHNASGDKRSWMPSLSTLCLNSRTSKKNRLWFHACSAKNIAHVLSTTPARATKRRMTNVRPHPKTPVFAKWHIVHYILAPIVPHWKWMRSKTLLATMLIISPFECCACQIFALLPLPIDPYTLTPRRFWLFADLTDCLS